MDPELVDFINSRPIRRLMDPELIDFINFSSIWTSLEASNPLQINEINQFGIH